MSLIDEWFEDEGGIEPKDSLLRLFEKGFDSWNFSRVDPIRETAVSKDPEYNIGEQFDPGDCTEKELRKRFTRRFEEMNERRKRAWAADPEYYRPFIEQDRKEKEQEAANE